MTVEITRNPDGPERKQMRVDNIETDLMFIHESGGGCWEEVSRKGELDVCDKSAVAVRLDVDGHGYPVCAYHTRAPMVPLAKLLVNAAAIGLGAR